VSEWQNLTLPALDATRGGDGALWPSRWPAAALRVRQGEVGDQDWESLYQQHPVARRGRVFPAFDRTTHVRKYAELERLYKARDRWLFRRVVVGVDFGWSHPGAAIVVGLTGTGTLVVVHEEVHQHLLVALEHAPGRRGWLGIFRALRDAYRPERFAADPSEPGNITSMRMDLDGRPVVENAQNDVTEGIRRINRALQRGPDGAPGLLVSDACKHLIGELETWSYKTLGGHASEVPQDVGEDAADGLRYAAMALTSF
jgi:hypothetical protein